MRRRRKACLRVAELGRSRGGLTGKVHLAAGHRCRPLSLVLTPGQAAGSPRFTAVLEHMKVRGPVGRPRPRPDTVAADKTSHADKRQAAAAVSCAVCWFGKAVVSSEIRPFWRQRKSSAREAGSVVADLRQGGRAR